MVASIVCGAVWLAGMYWVCQPLRDYAAIRGTKHPE